MSWTTLAGKLEQARTLDAAVGVVGRAVDAVLPRGPVKDALHGRWLGHPLHPLLIVLPIGTWSAASLLDVLGGEGSQRAARRLVGTGLLLVGPTAAAGFSDWSELGAYRRPKRVGLVHAGANTASALLYAASWLARRRGQHARGRDLAFAGAAGVMVGGYLGGHLTYSLGVGVNRNADEQKAPRDWTDATAVGDVAEGSLHRVEVDGQQVLIARHDGELHALGATCSHYGGPLEQGELRDGCVICPWHQSHFRLHDGSVARGPATSPQLRYDVRVRGERVEVKVQA